MSRLNLPDVVVRFMGDGSDLEAAFTKLEGRATSFAGKLSATALFAGIAGASVKVFASFDDAMTRSLAHANDLSEASSKAMSDAARDISRHSLSSASDLATAYTPLLQAGFSAKGAIDALAISEKFAVASSTTATAAAKELTQALTAQRMITGDTTQDLLNMSRISDVVTRSTQLASISAKDMADALGGKLGIAARYLGKDMEELAALHLALAQGGFHGSSAASIEETLFRNLQSAAVKNKDVWESMGVSPFDDSGKLLNMSDIVSKLTGRFAGLGDEQKMAGLTMLGFNARTLLPIMSIEGLSKNINYFEEQLRKASGTTDVFASKILNDFLSQLIKTWNSVKDLGLQIGEMLVPYLRVLVGWINNAIDQWNNINPAIRLVIITIGLLVGALFLVGVAFGVIGSVISVIVAPFMALGTALAAMMAPEVIGVVAAAVALAAAVGGLAYWLYGPEGIEAGWNASLEAAKKFFMDTLGFLVNFQENMGIFGTWIHDNWKAILNDMWELTKTIFSNMWTNLIANAKAYWGSVIDMFVTLLGWLSTNSKKLLDDVMAILGPIGKNMYENMKVYMTMLGRFILATFAWVGTHIEDILTSNIVKAIAAGFVALPFIMIYAFKEGFSLLSSFLAKTGANIFSDLASGRNPLDGIFGTKEQLAGKVLGLRKGMEDFSNTLDVETAKAAGHDNLTDRFAEIYGEENKKMVPLLKGVKPQATADYAGLMSLLWKDIVKNYGGAGFVSPFAGFIPTAGKLGFNLKIPDWDAAKAADEREKRLGKEGMAAGPMDFDSPLAKPGRGPGSDFKELAANRFIVQSSYSLAGIQEQKVRAPAIESKFDKLLAILQGIKEKGSQTKIAPNKNTPVLDVAPAVFDD